MRELLRQFYSIWHGIKPLQKVTLLAVVITLGTILGFVLIKSGGQYRRIASSDEKQVKRYLESAGVPYKEKGGALLVSGSQADSLRDELAFLKEEKGFELFDSNTWIKGEKELQVLEMRALKGQLERDLTHFESIKSARVILDLAPARKFGGQQYQTKASVILTLMPGARLGSSQLRAITSHLAGAVRGLESSMVAISDTSGRLYQAIDGDKNELIEEQQRLDQVINLLEKMVGSEHFLIEGNEIFVDHMVPDLPQIEKAVTIFGDVRLHPVPFKLATTKSAKSFGMLNLIFFLGMAAIAIAVAFPFVRKRKERKLMKMATEVDMGVLASSLRDEEPEVVAWMLSYMEPQKAEEMVASFPPEYQEELLLHLAELEKDEL
ncbi:MAG: hypothetical protein S4CHLAM81_02490 [Chlamydiales bacterium]|nr:hypothetical protein [Chlamydiales bacterium]MCH9635041.1 hypothetical protein [Chlamydiales bacterium]MCH9703648.1 hypothetical protein [Chlamydiota bacterium]